VSDPLKEYLQARLRLPGSAITVVRNGIDTEAFRPGPRPGLLRRELGLAPDHRIVGSVGRLEPVKGYDVLVRAFGRACRHGTATSSPALVIAGEGSERHALEALIRALGISDRVFLLGWRDDTRDLLLEFDCFALGSRSEGTSISLLEAMASGLPPAVTDVGGNRDVLGPELCDQLAPSENSTSLAVRITTALDPRRAPSLSIAARRRVASSFDVKAMLSCYEDLYQRIAR
jgi:glycosyltransferase involved in cell wall biosynthesis